MSHDYHEGPEDAVLYDGCAECDARATKPLDALLNLDDRSFPILLARVRAVEFGDGSASYLTGNEAALGRALYGILILLERHPSLAVVS
jgi:hypothetical protein